MKVECDTQRVVNTKLFIFVELGMRIILILCTVCVCVCLPALILWDCQNKMPQTGWLTLKIYFHTVQEALSLKSRCHQSHAHCEGSGEESFLASS